MKPRLEAFWAAENGHVVDMADIPEVVQPNALARLHEGTAVLQCKWTFADPQNPQTGADYFLPEKVKQRQLADQARIERIIEQLKNTIYIPDPLEKGGVHE